MAWPPLRRVLALMLCLMAARAGAATVADTEQWFLATVDHYETEYYVLMVEFPEAGLAVRRLDLMVLGIGAPSHGHLRHATETFNRLADLDDYRAVVDTNMSRVHFVRRQPRHVGQPRSTDLLLTATINQRRMPKPALVRFHNGEFYLPRQSVQAFGFNAGSVSGFREEAGIPLHALAGETFSVDLRNLELKMSVPPEYLEKTVIGAAGSAGPVRAQSRFSAILDYRLTGGEDVSGEPWQSATGELSLGSGSALCRSAHFYRSREERTDRIESLCRMDFPGAMFAVTLGDQVSAPGSLGVPVRYGGLRLGTDFSLAPEFLTQPALGLSGSARVPSVLELWANQNLIVEREIPPGPFEVTEVPAFTGAGELRAVVDDGSGVPSVISRPFYSDPSLLAEGLLDWSVEGGRKRQGVLTADDRYTEGFTVLNGRYGVRDWLTLGGHAEHQQALDMGSLSGTLRVGYLGVLELGGAVSRTRDGLRGQAGLLGFSRRGDHLSFSYNETVTGDDFTRLGYEMPGSAPARDRRFRLGFDTRYRITTTLSRVRREFRDQPDQLFNSAVVSLPFFRRGSLQFSALDVVEPDPERVYGLHLTLPLGARDTATFAAEGRQLGNRRLSLQRNLPAGPGLGYRISAGEAEDDTRSGSGDLFWRSRRALFRLHGERRGERDSGFGEVSGSVIGAGGGYLAPQSSGSYAVVDAGEPGVRVYHENREMGETGRNGTLVIPGLRAYEENSLSLAPEDLSPGAQLKSPEIRVTPGRRQAVKADFSISRDRYLRARLRRPNGDYVPAGADYRSRDGGETVVVGRRGLLYLSVNDSARLAGTVRWRGGSCELDWPLPADAGQQIDGGEVPCR